ncbi:hypothetical protein GUITHDRAFT_153074, partial [Guillardia theta CCMP2712]
MIAQGLRSLTQRVVSKPASSRSMSLWQKSIKELSREEVWPFLAGGVITGIIVWKMTPSSKSEYAKHSTFQQRCDGTYKPHHH